MKYIFGVIAIIFILVVIGTKFNNDNLPAKKLQSCTFGFTERYIAIRKYEPDIPDLAHSECEQVFTLIDQGDSAQVCMFDTEKLESVCKPDKWYQATDTFKITTHSDGLSTYYTIGTEYDFEGKEPSRAYIYTLPLWPK